MFQVTSDRIEEGYWWLPDDPQLKIPGTLKFSIQNGIQLDLLGLFPKENVQDPRGFNILGESTFGKPITVHQAFFQSSESSGNSSATGKSSFFASKAFLGTHFHGMNEAKFEKISFETPYLDKWLNLPVFTHEIRNRGFTLTYDMPESLVINPDKNIQVKVDYKLSGPGFINRNTEQSFSHRSAVLIELPDAPHFNNFASIIVHLTNFLALAVGAPVRPVNLFGWLPSSSNTSKMASFENVEILLPLHTQVYETDINSFDFLFNYKIIKDRLPQFLTNWFDKSSNLQPVFDLFFGVLYNNNPYPITTFLNYIQAIETYHIRTFPDQVDPSELHKIRMESILKEVPKEHKDWLNEKLAFSNRLTMAQRLREVINTYSFPVTSQVGDHEIFISQIRDTRNYYTHYDPSLEKKALKGGHLKGVSMTLGTLLEGLLLHELGFPFEEIRNLQRKRRRIPSCWL